MKKLDVEEQSILSAYEAGALTSVASKAELAKFKAAARSTAVIVSNAWQRRRRDRWLERRARARA